MMAKDRNDLPNVYIALGTNIGDRERHMNKALKRLEAHPLIRIVRCSPVYETDPVGYVDQPAFLNAVAVLRTELSPQELLAVLLETERVLGRTRDIRWGPRTIDLDLLLYGDRIVDEEPELMIPHPRMLERAFVLVPLADVLEDDIIPGLDEPVTAWLERLDGKEGVTRWIDSSMSSSPSASGHSGN